tara:strand:+ start:492 stop:1793 length:1302 start_codon:yes stop_codon:yes gene_type:complete
MKKIYVLLLTLFAFQCSDRSQKTITIINPIQVTSLETVRNGIDILIEDYPNFLHGKAVGLVTNHTGITRHERKNYEVFKENPNITLTKIFAPEHGFFGEASAGAKVDYDNANEIGTKIISLYGRDRKPTSDMLKGLDVIIYDIQDIGARFYTYISTLGLVMEAAGENGIEVIVLDRPNPIGGEIIEGPILDTTYKSFVGYYPIPVRYGLTVGELSQMAIKEGWLEINPPHLTIFKMDGWKRKMFFDDTQLPWIPPSPNIPDLETAIIYPGMCLYEATNISEGRGTNKPFKQIGAPWMNYDIAKELKGLGIDGADINYAKFKPIGLTGKAENPKFKGELCLGFQTTITDRLKYRSLNTAIESIYINFAFYPENLRYKKERMGKLFGNNDLFKLVTGKLFNDNKKKIRVPSGLIKMMEKDSEKFEDFSKPYYLYD